MTSQYGHGFHSKKIGDLFVLNSYIDKLYIKMLGFSKSNFYLEYKENNENDMTFCYFSCLGRYILFWAHIYGSSQLVGAHPLFLGLGLVECAILCVKSWDILLEQPVCTLFQLSYN